MDFEPEDLPDDFSDLLPELPDDFPELPEDAEDALPELLPELVVMAALDVGRLILAIAGLSFLGLSSQPPIPEWGYMLSEGKRYMQTAPWMLVYPGLVILICVIIFNLLGDSLRDILDPRNETI